MGYFDRLFGGFQWNSPQRYRDTEKAQRKIQISLFSVFSPCLCASVVDPLFPLAKAVPGRTP